MEYGYKNADDSKRFKVWPRSGYENGYGWDVDVWEDRENVSTFSQDAGDVFRTKADALTWIRITYGPIRLMPAGWSTIGDKWRK